MGNADVSMKDFLKINEIFAQIFNVGVFHNKSRLQIDDLIELDTVSEAVFENKEGKVNAIERLRDIKKLSRMGIAFQVILGIEEQTRVHYYMPVRCMQYDAFAYEIQCKQITEKTKKSGINFSYTDGIPKGSKILPIITLVFYVGSKEWDGPRQLFDMFSLEQEECKWIEEYVHNYGMNLLDARHLSDEEIDCFEGDLKAFFIMLKDSYDRSKVKNIIATYRETWYALSAIKHDNRYREYIDKVSDEELEGGIDVCTTLDYYETKGRQEGLIDQIQKKIRKQKNLAQISDEIEMEYTELKNMYDFVLQHMDLTPEEITELYLEQ